jgi:Flp pilus assembly protein TadD
MQMRIFFIFVFLFLFFKGNAQTRLPNVISKSDGKKVIKARRMLNNFHLFEGEKKFKELRDKHPLDAYFHEALVQVQYQIYNQIKLAQGENDNELDSLGNDNFGFGNSTLSENTQLSYKEVFVENGLDRGEEGKKAKKEKKVNKRKEKRNKKEIEEQEIQSEEDKKASATIDESLKSNKDFDEEIEEMLTSTSLTKEEKEILKNKKEAHRMRDLFLLAPETYKEDLINNCRNATRLHYKVDSASHYLRMFFVDTPTVKTYLDEDDALSFSEALNFSASHEYPHAIPLLKKVVAKNQENYDVRIALAKAYLESGFDSLAFSEYRYLTAQVPNRPEAFLGLSNWYLYKGLYLDASTYAIEAILVYPEHQYWDQLKTVVEKAGKKFDPHWISREVYPLNTENNFEEIVVTDKSPWFHYQAAKAPVYGYTPPTGIIGNNELTKERYLEVYGWNFMLARAAKKDPYPFARVMQKIGYLDCYTLISLFHQDLYPQFVDLVKQHPKKVRQYFYMLLNWEDKRFDEYRKMLKK